MKHISTLILVSLIQQELRRQAVTEYRFAPPRKWRFDIAIPNEKIAIELEGGVFTQGRHTRGVGYLNDMEKYNAATALGWRVLRFAHVRHNYTDILQAVREVTANSPIDNQPNSQL
jgi:very-short-patch-repair endonuclease